MNIPTTILMLCVIPGIPPIEVATKVGVELRVPDDANRAYLKLFGEDRVWVCIIGREAVARLCVAMDADRRLQEAVQSAWIAYLAELLVASDAYQAGFRAVVRAVENEVEPAVVDDKAFSALRGAEYVRVLALRERRARGEAIAVGNRRVELAMGEYAIESFPKLMRKEASLREAFCVSVLDAAAKAGNPAVHVPDMVRGAILSDAVCSGRAETRLARHLGSLGGSPAFDLRAAISEECRSGGSLCGLEFKQLIALREPPGDAPTSRTQRIRDLLAAACIREAELYEEHLAVSHEVSKAMHESNVRGTSLPNVIVERANRNARAIVSSRWQTVNEIAGALHDGDEKRARVWLAAALAHMFPGAFAKDKVDLIMQSARDRFAEQPDRLEPINRVFAEYCESRLDLRVLLCGVRVDGALYINMQSASSRVNVERYAAELQVLCSSTVERLKTYLHESEYELLEVIEPPSEVE